MTGINIQVDANPARLNAYMKRIEGLTLRGADPAPALEQIYRKFLLTERGIFASQGGSKPWAPLTAKYLRSKKGYDQRIERRTGALAEALMTGRGAGAVKEITPEGMTFGTNLKQAIYAQRGSGRKRRRLITADARRRAQWVGIIRNYLLDNQLDTGGDE